MAENEPKRIKFCRFCDGVIEWGVKVCPHCGKNLEIMSFDDMEFVTDSFAAPKVEGLRDKPKLPPDMERRRQAALAKKEGRQPPKPSPPEPPAGEEMEEAPLEEIPEAPVMKPVAPPSGKPPVMKPVAPPSGKPPVMKPVAPPSGKPPVMKPVAPPPGKPPVMKPVEAPSKVREKVAEPITGPVEEEPPMVAPIAEDAPTELSLKPLRLEDLPDGVVPIIEDCPVCGHDIHEAGGRGGTCTSCEATSCVVCLMRANAIKVTKSPDRNVKLWAGYLKKTRSRQIRCPACGKRGVNPP